MSSLSAVGSMYSTVWALRSCKRGRLRGYGLLELFIVHERTSFAMLFAFSSAFAAASSASFAFRFSSPAFPSGVCVSASGLDVLIQVVISGEKVRGEIQDVAG